MSNSNFTDIDMDDYIPKTDDDTYEKEDTLNA